MLLIPGVNIHCCSKELKGLAAALSPQTSFSYKHGYISKQYPVELFNVTYKDAWEAYTALKEKWNLDEFLTMEYVLKEKFLQHKDLLDEVQKLGGDDWIDLCSHVVTDDWKQRRNTWQGIQRQSLYIRCLSSAYKLIE